MLHGERQTGRIARDGVGTSPSPTRYHGAAPVVSAMYHRGLVEAVAYPQRAVFAAALSFCRAEQILPALLDRVPHGVPTGPSGRDR